MDMNSILMIIGIIVLLGVAGGCVFATMKVRNLHAKMDSEFGPKLDGLKAKTEALVPAVAQTEDLMRSVNVALDALDMELVKADAKLDQLAALTGKISDVTETAPKVAKGMGATLKAAILPKR